MESKHKRTLLVLLICIMAANLIYLLEYRQIRLLGDLGNNITKAVLSSIMPTVPINMSEQEEKQGNVLLMLAGLHPLQPQGTAFLLSMNSSVYRYYDNNYPSNGYYKDSYKKDNGISAAIDNIIEQSKLPVDLSQLPPGDFEMPVASSIYMDEEGGREDQRPDDSHANYDSQVAINNCSGYVIDVVSLLNSTLKLNVSIGNSQPQVLIVHTHTTEAYTGGTSSYISKNTKDESKNVTAVGAKIADLLQNTYGIKTIHINTIHDMPDYNMAYLNALSSISSTLKKYPTIKVVLDIHRDGLADDTPYSPVATVGGKSAARVMAVIGTSASGLYHPFWKDNAAFGIKFTAELDKIAPGLSRPVYISEYRYNQHLSKGAIIVEVGGDGNSVSQALESAKYITDAIAAVLK